MTNHTAAQPLDLDKLAEIANRVRARGLFNASCDILDWIQEAHSAHARAAQPESATGTTGASVPTWQERYAALSQAPNELIAERRKGACRDQEIADLRAQLAAKGQGEFAWAAFADNGNVIIWSRRRDEVEPVAAKYGKPVVPVVYLAAPASAQPADELDHGETVLRVQEALGITRTGWVSPDVIMLRIKQLQKASAQPADERLRNVAQSILSRWDKVAPCDMLSDEHIALRDALEVSAQPDRGAAVAPSDAPGKVVDLAGAEFLSKRLARVARAAGVSMPDGSHEFIAGVAGTILGDIARKLESAKGKADAAKCRGCDPAEGFCKDCRSAERRKADAANAGERALFEAYMRDEGATDDDLKTPYDGRYFWEATARAWLVWQARAALATSAADAKDAEPMSARDIEVLFKHSGGRWTDGSYWVIEDADLIPFVRAAIDAAMAAAPSSEIGGAK